VAPGGQTSAAKAAGHTEPGTVMGTVGYMSPEQVRGFPVDHRSDIFSFGTILYELLTGRKAFKKGTASDTMAAILRDEPPDLSASGKDIAPALDHIVRHCLKKDRDNRLQSARDIAFALSGASSPVLTSGAQVAVSPTRKRKVLITAGAIVVLAAAAGILLLRGLHEGASEAPGPRRLAVLPFENLGSAEDDYFADGMADEVRGKLSSLPGLQIIARGSSTPYKKTTKTPKQIAEELNVSYLLTATVRWEKSGGTSRVHVSPELVDVTRPDAPTSEWQQPFDAALTNVFQVQSDIASRVAQALGVALGAGDQKRISEKPTENLAAYDAFLRGGEAWKSEDPPSLRKALGYFEQAVALDPGFALAWARLSSANSLLYANSTPTPGLAERARVAAEKAVALAPTAPRGYLASGNYQRLVVKDYSRALEQYAKGLRVAPGNADLLTATARAEEALGRWEAAVEHLGQAEHLEPRSVSTHQGLGEALLYLRRYPEAREAFDLGLALAPANLGLIEFKAMTFLGEGDLAGARAVLQTALKDVEPTELAAFVAGYNDTFWVLDQGQRELLLRLTPRAFDDDRGVWAVCLLEASALRGDTANVRVYAGEACKAFEEQRRATPEDPQLRANLGLALAYIGRKEEAIREGERAVALAPVARDAVEGPSYQHNLVRIYILVGEPEKALDQIAALLKIPYWLSPGWLKIDPSFDPLRQNPRFQNLVANAK
jgi:TolB-like protein/Flp pilus assembly protein TadD